MDSLITFFEYAKVIHFYNKTKAKQNSSLNPFITSLYHIIFMLRYFAAAKSKKTKMKSRKKKIKQPFITAKQPFIKMQQGMRSFLYDLKCGIPSFGLAKSDTAAANSNFFYTFATLILLLPHNIKAKIEFKVTKSNKNKLIQMKKTFFLALALMIFANIAVGQKYGATPEDSTNCLINYSIYNELYKQKNYKECYEPWKKMMSLCPARHINDYIRGRNIIIWCIENAANADEKTKYINELLALSDQRAKYFGDEANNIAQKARDISDYYPEKVEEIYNLYKEAAEKGKDKLEPRYVPLYLQSTLQYIKGTGKAENLSLLFDVYDYGSEVLDDALIAIEQDIEAAEAAKQSTVKLNKSKQETQSYATMCENYIQPYASCEQLIPLYQSKYEANPQDTNLLKKITTTLEKKGCTNSGLFFSATESLHKMEPTAKTAYMMGAMLFQKGSYSEAAKYFEEAIAGYKDNMSKAKAYKALANAYKGSNQYGNARSAAVKWGELDHTATGEAALFIAELYYASSASCASHEGKIRGAAWVAYDEAARIKNAYPELAEKAQSLMNRAYAQFPAKKDVFFVGLTEGKSFSVGCWIGKSTTVRGK